LKESKDAKNSENNPTGTLSGALYNISFQQKGTEFTLASAIGSMLLFKISKRRMLVLFTLPF
jgi:hypothetical protein